MLLKRTGKSQGFQFISLTCIISLGLIAIIGCGGGGDGTAPAPGPTPIAYTGLTTQASIDLVTKLRPLLPGPTEQDRQVPHSVVSVLLRPVQMRTPSLSER